MKVLSKKFFEKDTQSVAKGLLGAILVVGKCKGRVVETEAYLGEDDLASHASKKSKKRNHVMYGKAGTCYVYFTYGFHWMFNVVTEKVGTAGAVLIRALEPLNGVLLMQKRRATKDIYNLCSGPAKLCQAFSITGDLNAKTLSKNTVYFLAGEKVKEIICAPRIGITKGTEHLLRFYEKDNKFVSRKQKFI